jgi:hypothetical protein
MKHRVATALFLFIALFFSVDVANAKFETQQNDVLCTFGGTFKPEMFFGANTSLLNKNNVGNEVWYMRHTLDLNLALAYGKETYGSSVLNTRFDIRNKGVWGNPESIARTIEATVKDVDVVEGAHKHAIPRHIFWMRQAWIEFDLKHFLGLSFLTKHSFKLGLFPFQLGRGISLGSAYAVGPELLGFYSDSAVDQFAPGGLLHGDIVEDVLSYDLYAAILHNKSSSLGDTGAAIYGQEYGRRETPQRGSGKINFLIASRLNWDVFKHDTYGHLHVEPYGLYNKDLEQRVEFTGDASSQLGTLGMAVEYTNDYFEFGCDYAFNIGQQRVKGWDRNSVTKENRDGQAVFVNSHVVDESTSKKIPYVKGSTAQKEIDRPTASQDESLNGKPIDTIDSNIGFLSGPVTMQNAKNRFRNPYTNKYEGWMFVADAGVWAYKKDLFIAAAVGVASGDRNPNEETVDYQYSGFIPLQDIYSGQRVESAFFGSFNRPLSAPTNQAAPSPFASVVDRFTNIVNCGFSIKYEPQDVSTPFKIFPNGIAYWQQKATNKFDAKTKTELKDEASTFLGVELNIFAHWMVMKDLKLYFVGAVFFPGQHYRDIKGKPLNPAQQKALDRLDTTGFDEDRIPNIGDSTAYTFNLGIEYKF